MVVVTKFFSSYVNVHSYYSRYVSGHPEMDMQLHRFYTPYLQNDSGLCPLVIQFVRRLRDVMRCDKMTLKSNWVKTGLLQLSHVMLFEPSSRTLFDDIDLSSRENDFRLLDRNIHFLLSLFPDWIYRCFFRHVLAARFRLSNL